MRRAASTRVLVGALVTATIAIEPARAERLEPAPPVTDETAAPIFDEETDESRDPPRVTSPGWSPWLATRWQPATPPPVQVAEAPVAAEIVDEAPPPVETVGAETIEIVDRPPPGAQSEVDEETLERSEHDDVHKVLATVPGVYLRDEDGYGLRPNIGMRGAAAERSAKVALMEDGVLIAPAPYSAPAAYYFPLVTRMSKVEVTKGPAAIEYGPNTVGGAVDMIGEPIPRERTGYLDVALGSDLYGKIHGRAAEGHERWGVMAEVVKLRTDGFKKLDGGGDTGFDKNDAQVSARVSSAATAHAYHEGEVRVGYATEESDETYTGLTDADFAASPQRRYVATRDDHMSWNHWRMRAVHRFELGTELKVETTAYRHQFDRRWGKVDGFDGLRDFYGLLAEPTRGLNQVYFGVLTGEANSSSDDLELIRGTNDRQFVSQGVQTQLRLTATLGPTEHRVDAGFRIHHDSARRRRFEDRFDMVDRRLVSAGKPTDITVDSDARTLALSLHVQDTVQWRRLELVAGTRVEVIDFDFEDHIAKMPALRSGADTYPVVIPGGGAQYHVTDELTVLAGIHRGFTPSAPAAGARRRPESSINYEAGARWSSERVRADLIGFFNDYSNLTVDCGGSGGCTEQQIGMQFDGGRVHILGLEASTASDVALTRSLHAPVQAAYTFTSATFQTEFDSEHFGEVMKGDEMPYVPAHQLAIAAALAGDIWELGTQLRWRSEMRDEVGQGEIPAATHIPALLTVDLSAHVRLGVWGELYATCDNVLDEQQIVARRPYGARPNSPRLFSLGYKARF